MEKNIHSFECRVIRVTEEGLSALDNEYLVKFHDSRIKHHFSIGDIVHFSIENIDEIGEDICRRGYSVIYITLKNHLPNGFSFIDFTPEKSFFWSQRGILTHRFFENNDGWEKGTKLRISLKKIYSQPQ